MVALLCACSGGRSSDDRPLPVDTGATDPADDAHTDDTGHDVTPDSDTDTDAPRSWPSCDTLYDQCEREGEFPWDCAALHARCEAGPWPQACVDAWAACATDTGAAATCGAQLLACFDASDHTDVPDDPCDHAFADCVASGRDTASCVGAGAACRDTAEPPDTDLPQDTATPGCDRRLTECLTAGVDVVWCTWLHDGCVTADTAAPQPCVDDYAVCVQTLPVRTCERHLRRCLVPTLDSGLDCDDVFDACLTAGTPATTCALDRMRCFGLDPDPVAACLVAQDVCLTAGTDPAVCTAEHTACLAATP